MHRKRRAETIIEGESNTKRYTRSSSAANRSTIDADSGYSTPPRKKHRAPSPGTEIENDNDYETPRAKRVRGRRLDKIVDLPSQGKVLEESAVDELNIGIDTPRSTRKRVVLESVEIITTTNEKCTSNLDHGILVEPPLGVDTSPSKRSTKRPAQVPKGPKSKEDHSSSEELPQILPVHFHGCLERQKQAVLIAFHASPFVDNQDVRAKDSSGPAANKVALQQLNDLLCGSIERGEGNSCLIVGPAGSGKSKIFEGALREFEEEHRPIVIRLNGHVHHTDRLAIREIARQVVEQSGSKAFETLNIDDDDNPFNDQESGAFINSLPPPSHLPSLIAALPSLPRPVVVLLDAFDIFTQQPRQALLYCLLDTVQSCRAGSLSQRGLAVIGLTSRMDVVNFLEKRVKSRFSHRIFRTASLRRTEEWIAFLHHCLCVHICMSEDSALSEWRRIWEQSVSSFLQDRSVKDALRDMFNISRDFRRLLRVLADAITHLTPSFPYLTLEAVQQGIGLQFSKPRASLLMGLNYPSLSLCIAAQHVRTAGHDSFTFEMLYDLFSTQVRTSSAAPVMLGRGSIGMVNIGRRVLMGAFEELVRMTIFAQAAPSTASLSKDFIKYRCVVERDDVKVAVDRIGQTNLKKWFNKAQ